MLPHSTGNAVLGKIGFHSAIILSILIIPSSLVAAVAPTFGTAPYTYSVISGPFSVSNTGVVSTFQQLARDHLNGAVQIRDAHGLTVTHTIRYLVSAGIHGSLVNPVLNVPISQCLGGGTFPVFSNVGQVIANPWSGTAPFSYAINDTNSGFTISSTGIIQLGVTLSAGRYLVHVAVTDTGGVTKISTVTINLFATSTSIPVLSSTAFCLPNTAKTTVGQTVGSITGSAGSGSGYMFTSISANFSVSTGGVIIANTAGPAGAYQVHITITDGAGHINSQIVAVNITTAAICKSVAALAIPITKFTAACTPPFSFIFPDSTVGTVAATGGTSPYTYTFAVQDGNFQIDPSNGLITTNTLLLQYLEPTRSS